MLPMYAPLRRPVDTRAVAEDDCGVAADTGVVPAAPLAAGVVVPLASRAKKEEEEEEAARGSLWLPAVAEEERCGGCVWRPKGCSWWATGA